MDTQILMAVVIPVLMFVGGIAAWQSTKRHNEKVESESAGWRDDSLDDWRRERDEAAEAERLRRASTNDTTLSTGRAEEQNEAKRNQRIGG